MNLIFNTHIDLGAIGEVPVEVKADVMDDRPFSNALEVSNIYVTVTIEGKAIDLADMINDDLMDDYRVQLCEMYREAESAAREYMGSRYRHLDCYA